MLAVVESGGKQYIVKKDDRILVEKLPYEAGAKFDIDKVLLISDDSNTKIGTPYVEGSTVSVTVENQVKGKKLTTVKYKKRKNYKRTIGHRQKYTLLKVTDIKG